jgi:hypothetical protein
MEISAGAEAESLARPPCRCRCHALAVRLPLSAVRVSGSGSGGMSERRRGGPGGHAVTILGCRGNGTVRCSGRGLSSVSQTLTMTRYGPFRSPGGLAPAVPAAARAEN